MDTKKALGYGVGLAAIGVGAYFLFKQQPVPPPPPPEPEPDKANIYGQVTDAMSNLAVPGASVQVGTSQTITDENGNFYILDKAPMMYSISASKEGYNTYTGSINVITGNNGFSIMLVPVAVPPEPPDPPAPAKANIYGQVVDSVSGSPVSGATVLVGSYETSTNNEGNFYVLNKDPMIYTVIINKDGYASYADSITVTEGNNMIQINLVPVTEPEPEPEPEPNTPVKLPLTYIDVYKVADRDIYEVNGTLQFSENNQMFVVNLPYSFSIYWFNKGIPKDPWS